MDLNLLKVLNFTEKLDPGYATFTNAPIILKENYQINGSDTAQIGWIEVTSENGANGYLWYMKSEHETRLRWEDYLEMSMVEGVKYTAGGAAIAPASPQPLAPNGFEVAGVVVKSSLNCGKLSALGIV